VLADNKVRKSASAQPRVYMAVHLAP
jgi:hypothetical protein